LKDGPKKHDKSLVSKTKKKANHSYSIVYQTTHSIYMVVDSSLTISPSVDFASNFPSTTSSSPEEDAAFMTNE
jgi:hypothetical protein